MEGDGDQVSQPTWMVNLIEAFQYLFRKGLPHGEGDLEEGPNALDKGLGKDGLLLLLVHLLNVCFEIRKLHG